MKKIIIVTLLLTISGNLFAQRPGRFERIKALKIAYITDKLNLSSQEAEVFWPVYNQYEDALNQLKVVKRRSLMKQIRMRGGVDQLTDREATNLVQEYKKLQADIFTKEQEKIKALEKILPAKKLLKLYRAEETFKKELIQRLKQQRGKK